MPAEVRSWPTALSSGGTKANPTKPRYGESKIRLGEDFFNEIISHPVPIDMNTLKALKRCALGLDLYLWLVRCDLQFGDLAALS